MINILLEGFDIDAPWIYDELKNYIKPNHSVAIVAFSFRDSRVKSLSDWDALYGKVNSKYYDRIVGGLTSYGIPANKITFINYFTDTKESAIQKIQAADIIYFLGGLPDRMMDRIKEVDLYAPGIEIYTTYTGDAYQMGTGIAFAAASTAGVAALIKAYYPELTGAQIRDLLIENVTSRKGVEVEKGIRVNGQQTQDLFLFDDLCIAGGILNAYQAVVAADKLAK